MTTEWTHLCSAMAIYITLLVCLHIPQVNLIYFQYMLRTVVLQSLNLFVLLESWRWTRQVVFLTQVWIAKYPCHPQYSLRTECDGVSNCFLLKCPVKRKRENGNTTLQSLVSRQGFIELINLMQCVCHILCSRWKSKKVITKK